MGGWRYAAALICCAALLTPAHAASSRADCPLITDPAGDVSLVEGAPADLLAVDIGTVGRTLTATVSLTAIDGTTPFLGHQYEVELASDGRRVMLVGTLDSGQSHFELLVQRRNGPATAEVVAEIDGSVDRKRRQVSMSADLITLGFPIGQRVVVVAQSSRSVSTVNNKGLGETGFTTPADGTHHSEPYRIGTRRCR